MAIHPESVYNPPLLGGSGRDTARSRWNPAAAVPIVLSAESRARSHASIFFRTALRFHADLYADPRRIWYRPLRLRHSSVSRMDPRTNRIETEDKSPAGSGSRS